MPTAFPEEFRRDIVARVEGGPDVVLLTHDGDFEHVSLAAGRVVISRVPQGLPLERRLDLWVSAIESLGRSPHPGSVMEITSAGELRPLQD